MDAERRMDRERKTRRIGPSQLAASCLREFNQTTDSFLIHGAASPSVANPSIRSIVPSGNVAHVIPADVGPLLNPRRPAAAHFISDRLKVRPTIALTPQPAQ